MNTRLSRLLEKLTPEEQAEVETFAAFLLARRPQRRSIMGLKGLGKEVWQSIDAQGYVDRERNAWSEVDGL